MTITLYDAIGMEDALDFMQRGFTKDQHVQCFDGKHQESEGETWDKAASLVAKLGTIRKAQKHVGRIIESHREVSA